MLRLGEPLTLSALPIYTPLHRGLVSASVELVSTSLEELGERMNAGSLDASPISILDYIRYKDRFDLLPGVSISSMGRSGNTVLLGKGSFASIRQIAVPEAAKGSHWYQWGCKLVCWLLEAMYGTHPEVVVETGTARELLTRYQAVLLCGRGALGVEEIPDTVTLDLGDAWWQATQTPLVHAVWVTSKTLSDEGFESISEWMSECKQRSGETLEEAVQAGLKLVEPTKLAQDRLDGYFRLCNFDLTPAHLKGIELLTQYLGQPVA